MQQKKIRKIIASKISNVAKEIACKTVGRSWPLGAYEVEIPEELKLKSEYHETD